MRRRGLLLLAAALPGCSVLPNRPYREVERFVLAPERPPGPPPPRSGQVLLLRTMRAAPGLEQRGLRILGARGEVTLQFWSEWTAPPVDLTEEALRRWLLASGRFRAVTAPGSRLRADLILEAELTRLQAEPAEGVARAGLSGLLLDNGSAENRVLGQFPVEGTAPLPGGAQPEDRLAPADAAAAMSAALGMALGRLERALGGAIGAGAGGGRVAGRR
ncbi:ABC-type transport auxiliary lipoprotein family protein [Roseicella frigidaeris]|nr:ABC-type transport auxiliary lipoprotein family protein [Roseicella frigidaeris]